MRDSRTSELWLSAIMACEVREVKLDQKVLWKKCIDEHYEIVGLATNHSHCRNISHFAKQPLDIIAE